MSFSRLTRVLVVWLPLAWYLVAVAKACLSRVVVDALEYIDRELWRLPLSLGSVDG